MPSATFVCDVHAHMCTNEIIGFLGGHWDSDRGTVYVIRAFPVSSLDLFGEDTRVNVEMDPESSHRTTEAQLTAAMDIFSAGCVIAELFLDGEPLFDLGRLLGYRRGDNTAISYVRDALLRISDPAIRGMVSSMISVDPMQRLRISCPYRARSYKRTYDRTLSQY